MMNSIEQPKTLEQEIADLTHRAIAAVRACDVIRMLSYESMGIRDSDAKAAGLYGAKIRQVIADIRNFGHIDVLSDTDFLQRDVFVHAPLHQ